MSAKNLPWFRAYTDMVDDVKLRLLAFEDRWHFVAILCCKGAGLLDSGDSPEMMRRKLAVKLGLAVRELDEVARRLADVDLVDFETLQPIAWDRRQFRSDQDPTAAERKRRQRQRQTVTSSDGTDMSRVTGTNVTRTDIDTDTEDNSPNGESSPESQNPAETGDLLGDSGDLPRVPNCPVKRIVDAYNRRLPMLAQVRELPEQTAKMIRARWRSDPARQSLGWWEDFFDYVGKCPFLIGEKTDFQADLLWLVKPTNFAKVINGNYEARSA